MQYSVRVRDAKLDAFEKTVGTGPLLEICTGQAPKNCAAAATGGLLFRLELPLDWLKASANGVKEMNGTWAGLALAAGLAGHFRIYSAAGAICDQQGSCSGKGGGGDMELEETEIAFGQPVIVIAYQLTAGNA